MNDLFVQVELNREAYLETPYTLPRQPSLSAQNLGVREFAGLLAGMVREAGMDAKIMETKGQPVIFAERIVSPDVFKILDEEKQCMEREVILQKTKEEIDLKKLAFIVLFTIIGWSISWIICFATSLNIFIILILTNSPILSNNPAIVQIISGVIGGAVGGGIGGLATMIALHRIVPSIKLNQIFIVAMGWAISMASGTAICRVSTSLIGLTIGGAIGGGIGGLATIIALHRIVPNIKPNQIFIVAMGWAIGGAIGAVIDRVIIVPNGFFAVGGVVAGAIGSGGMFLLLTHGKNKK